MHLAECERMTAAEALEAWQADLIPWEVFCGVLWKEGYLPPPPAERDA